MVVHRVSDVRRADTVSGQPGHRLHYAVSTGRPLRMSQTGHWPLTRITSDQSVCCWCWCCCCCCCCCWWWWWR